MIAADLLSCMAVASFFRVASAEVECMKSLKSGIEMPSSIDNIPKLTSSSSSDMPFIDFATARPFNANPNTLLSVDPFRKI